MGDRASRIAALTALCIQPIFFAYWLVAGLVEPGYSPTREFVSEMGASTAARPWLLDAMLVLWGTSLVAVAFAVRPARWAAVLLAVAGIATILAGPIHLSCAASIHPDCPGSHSFMDEAHNALAIVNQVALTLSGPALVWSLWPRLVAKLLIGPVAIALALLVRGLTASPHDPHAGLGQRIGFVAAQTWIVLLATGALVARGVD